jgi:Ca-activated chloride channel family protein
MTADRIAPRAPLLVLASALMLSVAGVLAQPATPRVILIEPTEESFLAGPSTLRAALEPADTAFSRAEFFVDGVAVCAVERSPLECTYDAGPAVAARTVRVAVSLATGQRVFASARTRSIEAETTGVISVLVPVVVYDGGGRFVRGLTRTAFTVLEDGVPQQVVFFQAENVPLDIALAIDVSDSMKPIIERVKDGARTLLSRLKPGDRVSLLAFNERVFVLTSQEADQAKRLEALDQLSPRGGTALFDAMVGGIAQLGQQISRRALIVFTDGGDQHSRATLAGVEQRLSESDVAIYLLTYGRRSESRTVRARLEKLAVASGGRAYHVNDPRDLTQLFSGIVDDISQHYLVSYTPARAERDGSFRRISVRVSVRGSHEVRARAGYRAIAPPR